MEEKTALYLNAGAREVWICSVDGELQFLFADLPQQDVASSAICPEFPKRIAP